MSFPEIAQRFAETSSGTDAFKVFYKEAFKLMQADPVNASLYFVPGIAAQSFVRNYEDQGITTEFADRSKAILVEFNAKIVQALASDPAERLRLLSEVALAYEWNVHDF
ncbi:hypothetical protein [Pseudorhodoferax sp.]|uniref:hypothetical protein n=1 Tax=Pseudorhodoferax sp. TaxID=1993553 RepID=UPI0039E2341A